jgi:hypothetical protein
MVAIAGPSHAADWEKRVDDFTAKTMAERQKLGLDKLSDDEQRQRFPTPEVRFEGHQTGEDLVIVLCPGEPKPISLEGTLPAGVLVVPTSDDIQVSKEKATPGHWSGVLTAKKSAAPLSFNLRAAIPLSGQSTDAWGLLVGCKFTFSVTVEGAVWTAKADIQSRTQVISGEWKKGGKILGAESYELSMREGGFSLKSDLSAEEMQRRINIMTEAMKTPKAKVLDVRGQKMLQDMEKCGKVPQDRMMACFAGPQAEAERIAKERAAITAEVEVQAAPVFGCDELSIETTGESAGLGCAGHRKDDRVPAKATWTSP